MIHVVTGNAHAHLGGNTVNAGVVNSAHHVDSVDIHQHWMDTSFRHRKENWLLRAACVQQVWAGVHLAHELQLCCCFEAKQAPLS